jgi:hypothetical protein
MVRDAEIASFAVVAVDTVQFNYKVEDDGMEYCPVQYSTSGPVVLQGYNPPRPSCTQLTACSQSVPGSL